VLSVAVLGSRLLVELNDGLAFENRIAALQGNVARLTVPIYEFDPPDPALARNPWIFMVEEATCSTLVTHPPGAARGRVAPNLATDMPKLSGDRRTYTFTVRSGVRFAPPSNAPVTAADVRASIERALSSKLGSDVPGIRFVEDVVGARELNRGVARHARGIEVSGTQSRSRSRGHRRTSSSGSHSPSSARYGQKRPRSPWAGSRPRAPSPTT
jgi:ABC-type transport system substrate-binding protein